MVAKPSRRKTEVRGSGGRTKAKNDKPKQKCRLRIRNESSLLTFFSPLYCDDNTTRSQTRRVVSESGTLLCYLMIYRVSFVFSPFQGLYYNTIIKKTIIVIQLKWNQTFYETTIVKNYLKYLYLINVQKNNNIIWRFIDLIKYPLHLVRPRESIMINYSFLSSPSAAVKNLKMSR